VTEKKLPRGLFERPEGSGVYWIRYADAAGKIRREKAGRLSTAVKLYQKRKTEIREGKKLPQNLRAPALAFSTLADDALEYSRANKLSYRDDEIRMEPIKSAFGSRQADTITPQEVERFLVRQTKTPATFNRYRALFSLTFKLGVQNGKVAVNPARLVRMKREDNARVRFLSDKEESALMAAVEKIGTQHLPQLVVAINTGLRKSEQFNLTWSNVDMERRVLTVPRSKHGGTRHVPINDAALSAFRTQHCLRNDTGYVFLNYRGERLASPREWFDKAVKDAKLEFLWHELRHTFASRLVMNGESLRTVQELMGHKTLSMTLRYAHLAPDFQLAAVQRLCQTKQSGQQSQAGSKRTTEEPTDTKTSTSERAESVQ
jgi:integrase